MSLKTELQSVVFNSQLLLAIKLTVL